MKLSVDVLKLARTAGVIAAVALPASALGAQDAGVSLVPPPTWEQRTGDAGGGQTYTYWLDPGPPTNGFRQSINLLHYPATVSLDDYVTQGIDLFHKQDANMRVVSRGPNDACPKGSSEILQMQTTASVGPITIEEVLTRSADVIFVATYTRAAAADADAEAVKAVEHACPSASA